MESAWQAVFHCSEQACITPRYAAATFWLVSLAYVGLLFWLDQDEARFSQLEEVFMTVPILLGRALTALILRGLRWQWLLTRAGHSTGTARGLLAYLNSEQPVLN